MTKWESLKRRLIAIVFPERCIWCGRVIPPLTLCCDTCREETTVIRPPICTYCGMEKEHCRCERKRHHYDRIVSPFYCETAVRSGILRLKRHADAILIEFLAKQMATVVRREFGKALPDVITFVPVTKRDQLARGYNQSELLAAALGKQLQIPVEPLLTKLYETKPQKMLSALFRSGNVFGVYDVCSERSLVGKTVLLTDDVLTTGCTLNECAKMLKLYGAETVWCVTASVRRAKNSKIYRKGLDKPRNKRVQFRIRRRSYE